MNKELNNIFKNLIDSLISEDLLKLKKIEKTLNKIKKDYDFKFLEGIKVQKYENNTLYLISKNPIIKTEFFVNKDIVMNILNKLLKGEKINITKIIIK